MNSAIAPTASPEVLALANHYLNKHRVPEDEFGLGPYLLTGEYELKVDIRTRIDGSIAIVFLDQPYHDCRKIANGMYANILTEHPELQPRLRMYTDHGRHTWVEISDPNNGAIIQIDSTPWFFGLNPGHIGIDGKQDSGQTYVRITMDGALPFTTHTEDGITRSVYLTGMLPNMSIHENIARREKGINGPIPDYRFIIFATRALFGEPNRKTLDMVLDVADARILHEMLGRTENIWELLEAKAVTLGMHLPEGGLLQLDFAALKELAGRLKGADLFAEIERGLPFMIRLLKRSTPCLEERREDRMTNVRTGDTTFLPLKIKPCGKDKILPKLLIEKIYPKKWMVLETRKQFSSPLKAVNR
jgi:hypothetical protein